jgi:hypothetical protein
LYTKFNFEIWEKSKILRFFYWVFRFIDGFSVDFLFKIQILNKNSKSVGFTDLSLDFFRFIAQVFLYLFFSKKNQNLIFLIVINQFLMNKKTGLIFTKTR